MPIGTSDGNVYEDEMHQALDIPRQPLRFTVHPEQKKGIGQGGTSDIESENAADEVHIFRHGDINLEDNHGWSPAPLNAEGENHAEKAANTANGIDLDALYNSDLPRTQQTADVISNKTAMPSTPTASLRTWDLGAYTGKTDQASIDAVKRLCTDALNEAPPSGNGYQGESFSSFKDRILGAVGGILSNHPGEKVGLIVHRAVHGILDSWDAAGQKANGKLNMDVFHKENIEPGGHVKMDLDAQAAREAAAHRMQRAASPSVGFDPFGEMTPGREQGLDYLKQSYENVKEQFTDLAKHPENIVGTGEFGPATGMFVGPKNTFAGWARTQLAEKAEKAGADALTIKKRFGLERGAEGKWREEISDMPGTLIHNTGDVSAKRTLGDIYKHDELYARYPQLKNLPVVLDLTASTGVLQSEWASDGKSLIPARIGLNPEGIRNWAKQNNRLYMDELKATLIHEIQHAIQYYEKFNVGNPSEFPKSFQTFAEKQFIQDWKNNPAEFQKFVKLFNDYAGTTQLQEGRSAQQYVKGDLNRFAKWFFYIQQHGEPEAMNTERRQYMERAGTLDRANTTGESTSYVPYENILTSSKVAGRMDFGPENRTNIIHQGEVVPSARGREAWETYATSQPEKSLQERLNDFVKDHPEYRQHPFGWTAEEVQALTHEEYLNGMDKGFADTYAEHVLRNRGGQTVQQPTGDISPKGPISKTARRVNVDPEHIKELLALPGVTQKDVAYALGISHGTLSDRMKELGIIPKNPSRARWPADREQKLLEMVRRGDRGEDIAKALDTTVGSVYSKLHEIGGRPKNPVAVPAEQQLSPTKPKVKLTPRDPDYTTNIPDWFIEEMKLK